MTKSVSSGVNEQLQGLARRLQDDPDFMAYVLVSYQEQERLSDDALAEYLSTTQAMLSRLALCRRPASNSPQFADEIRQIADYTNIDATHLANMVRQVSSLEKLAERPVGSRSQAEVASRKMQLQPGLLSAARDQDESEDDHSPIHSDESESPSE
jgi:hypothetical protein